MIKSYNDKARYYVTWFVATIALLFVVAIYGVDAKADDLENTTGKVVDEDYGFDYEQMYDEKVHVIDHADIFSDSDEELLISKCEQLENDLKVNFLIVSSKVSYNSNELIKVYKDVLQNRNYSAKGSVMLFIDMGSRDFIIESDDKNHDNRYFMGSKTIDYIIEKITQNLADGEYYYAMDQFLDLSEKYMTRNEDYNPGNIIYAWWFDILVAIIISCIIIVPAIINSGGKVTVDDRTYIKNPGTAIIDRRDTYINTVTTKYRKSSSTSGSGGSGSSGGGGGHGGGSGHF